ncbi:hypothetical protein [Labrys neptuniae]
MVYRRSEFRLWRLDVEYPCHVARHSPNGQVPNHNEVDEFSRTHGGAPRHHSVGDWENCHHIFCFKEEHHAKEFQEQFGGFPVEASPKARKALLAKLRACPKASDFGG